jgi:hypothetical protein
MAASTHDSLEIRLSLGVPDLLVSRVGASIVCRKLKCKC